MDDRKEKLQHLAERVMKEGCTQIRFLFPRKQVPRHQDPFFGFSVDRTRKQYDKLGFNLDEETVYKIAQLLMKQYEKNIEGQENI